MIDLIRQWPWIYPRGIDNSALDWIQRTQNREGWYNGPRRNWREELHRGGLADHVPPDNLPSSARRQFDAVRALPYPAAAMHHYSGACLIGPEGLFVSPDNRVQAEFFHLFGTTPVSSMVYRRPFGLFARDTVRVEEPVGLLASPQGWNYYHWIFDVLPRLHLLERWRGTITRYAVPANLSPVQLESLRHLGVDEDRLLRLTPGRRIRCQHLYVPSLPGSEGCYPPWSLAFLREAFLAKADGVRGEGPRIYIRRGPEAQRPISNEPDLIALLERRGFRVVSPEQEGFLRQVAIFRDARLVVAAHGAGLANLAFSPGPLGLLELFSRDYLRPDCYFTLARRAGHAYDFWLDDSGAAGRPWGAITADLRAVEGKIELLERNRPNP